MFKNFWKSREERYIDFFRGKSIIITGASSGIGKCLQEKLKKYDVKLFLLARSFTNKKVENRYFYGCDTSNNYDVKNTFSDIFQHTNTADIIIHSAGSGNWKYITEMNKTEIETGIGAPMMSSIWTTKEFLDGWDGIKEKKIIFINSPVVIQPWMSCTIYAASRFGMHGFAESLRMDYYGKNLVVQENILGKVNSSYFQNNKECDNRMPLISKSIPILELEETADYIIDKMIGKREVNIYPKMLGFINFCYYFFPSLVKYFIVKMGFC